ncbi:MAG: transposase [Pseudorhodoplanes sp.]|nr:MAG: transposase [Pseudorhodoplanes sp.]
MGKKPFWLDDVQWSKVSRRFSDDTNYPRMIDDRTAVSGIIHVLTTGCAWADCPPTYGPYRLLFWRYRRWLRRGLWETMAAASSGHGSAPMPARSFGLVAGVSPGRSKG